MTDYRITWELDLDASSPLDAAQKALSIHRDPASIATTFTVFDPATQQATEVDLDEAACRPLACPHCHDTENLRSDETGLIGYPAAFTTATRTPQYTGDSYEVFDEGTTFEDTITCTNCGAIDLTYGVLVTRSEDGSGAEGPDTTS